MGQRGSGPACDRRPARDGARLCQVPTRRVAADCVLLIPRRSALVEPGAMPSGASGSCPMPIWRVGVTDRTRRQPEDSPVHVGHDVRATQPGRAGRDETGAARGAAAADSGPRGAAAAELGPGTRAGLPRPRPRDRVSRASGRRTHPSVVPTLTPWRTLGYCPPHRWTAPTFTAPRPDPFRTWIRSTGGAGVKQRRDLCFFVSHRREDPLG